MEEGEAEPGEMPSLKRPNPITWQTPPKKPRVADASDESPADSADARQGREAGSVSASRAASSHQQQPSPAKGELSSVSVNLTSKALDMFKEHCCTHTYMYVCKAYYLHCKSICRRGCPCPARESALAFCSNATLDQAG